MAKYLFRGRFTSTGWQGAVKEGFAAREAYVRQLVESAGGSVEVFYFIYGEDDVIFVADVDPRAAAAFSMAANQTGAVEVSTSPLLNSAEMDEARHRLPNYQPPGA